MRRADFGPNKSRGRGRGCIDYLPAGLANVAFGPDVSRQTNALNTNTWGGLVQARLTRKDHDLRVFAEIQHTKVFNAFLSSSNPRAGTSGAYYFDSIADFQAVTRSASATSTRCHRSIPTMLRRCSITTATPSACRTPGGSTIC